MSSDWLPGTRAKIIEMCDTWVSVLATKASAWGVPGTDVTDLLALRVSATTLLAQADSPQRTPVIVAQCREAFDELKSAMRRMKQAYFHQPPLTDADFISLGLPPPDKEPTPHPAPTVRPDIEAVPSGRGKHTVRALDPATGKPKRPDLVRTVAFACRVREADEAPAPAGDMPSISRTQAEKDYQFTDADAGKVADYAVAYESGPEKRGPWSIVVSLTI